MPNDTAADHDTCGASASTGKHPDPRPLPPFTMIALGLALTLAQMRDSSPGGAGEVLLLAGGTGGLRLADGAGFLLLSH